jgi:biopolymer transport protein TolR
MAGGVQRRNGNGRRGAYRPMAEINVTPMVDVMLVLLIVFMVAAPLLTVGVEVDLPKANAPTLNQSVEPLTVAIKKDGSIFVQKTPADTTDLVDKLKAIGNAKPDTIIYVRGDAGVNYGRVVEVMGLLSTAGFTKATLTADPPDTGTK